LPVFISIRTLDAVTLSCAHRLFALARTPLTMSQLTLEAIDDAMHTCTFHEAKSTADTRDCVPGCDGPWWGTAV